LYKPSMIATKALDRIALRCNFVRRRSKRFGGLRRQSDSRRGRGTERASRLAPFLRRKLLPSHRFRLQELVTVPHRTTGWRGRKADTGSGMHSLIPTRE
jgi:hypothetical protein